MHVSYQKINHLITMGILVDLLVREEKDMIWLVAVEVSKKEKPGFRMLHLKKVKVHRDVVRQDGFLA